MTPLEFLNQEFENVKRALDETLRHDYGPGRTVEYYSECEERLARVHAKIPAVSATDAVQISDLLGELRSVAEWISLRERTRLGDFSWPFEDVLRKAAESLLSDRSLSGKTIAPIVHIVSEGVEYQIYYEHSSSSSVNTRRFVSIYFPRPLKHHVLFHALFGHELGHAALDTATSGSVLYGNVLAALLSAGPLSNLGALNAWIHDNTAPTDIQQQVTGYAKVNKTPFSFTEVTRASWVQEFMCDLFGLVTFGPAFLAAHRAFLLPIHPNPYHVRISDRASTHPMFASRHKLLVRATQLLGWEKPCTTVANGLAHDAEKDLLKYILDDPFSSWSQLFNDTQINAALLGIQSLIPAGSVVGYSPPTATTFACLFQALADGVPPVCATVDERGKPVLEKTRVSHILHVGWAYCVARNRFKPNLSFFETNRLCDHALLQQSAIDLVVNSGVT